MTTPALTLLFISYNAREPLLQVLEEVRGVAQTQVLVVDNASTDGTQAAVRELAPDVQLVAHKDNRGFSAAVNAGLAAARGARILLLNADVLLKRQVVAQLCAWDVGEDAAIYGFIHKSESGDVQLTWGRRPGWYREWLRRRRERRFRQGRGSVPPATLDVDWLSGSCLFFAAQTARRVGPWDERFFLYFEDIDWCVRAKDVGVAVRLCPDVELLHLHGYSVAGAPVETQAHYRESQLYYWYKHHGPGQARLLQWFLLWRLRGADPVIVDAVRRWTPPVKESLCG